MSAQEAVLKWAFPRADYARNMEQAGLDSGVQADRLRPMLRCQEPRS